LDAPGFLCHLGELGDPDSRGFEGRETGTPWDLFLVRRGGLVRAYRNRCPHTGAPLDWTPHRFLDLDGRFIQCALHGALFRLEDGFCVWGPCAGKGLARVAVRLEGDRVSLAE
jgi:nitrite reductase/ring-hydroxylating ferredoxin subunit